MPGDTPFQNLPGKESPNPPPEGVFTHKELAELGLSEEDIKEDFLARAFLFEKQGSSVIPATPSPSEMSGSIKKTTLDSSSPGVTTSLQDSLLADERPRKRLRRDTKGVLRSLQSNLENPKCRISTSTEGPTIADLTDKENNQPSDTTIEPLPTTMEHDNQDETMGDAADDSGNIYQVKMPCVVRTRDVAFD